MAKPDVDCGQRGHWGTVHFSSWHIGVRQFVVLSLLHLYGKLTIVVHAWLLLPQHQPQSICEVHSMVEQL